MFTLPFLKRKDRYLIVELSPEKERGLLFGVDRDKQFYFLKNWENFSLAAFTKSWNIPRKKISVIVVVDESSAFTVKIPVDFKGRDSKQPIVASELENILGQTVSRVFNQHRNQASKQLGVQELDAVLISSRVGDFKIDGHMVVNPIGFQPKDIRAVAELSFTTRDLYNRLKPLFELQQDFFFTQFAKAQLYALLKTQPMPLGLVSLEGSTSPFFLLEHDAVGYAMYRGKLPWSVDAFLDAISAEWDVGRSLAEHIYESYLRNDVSPSVHRRLTQLFKPIGAALFDELRKTKLSGSVFVRTSRELPFRIEGKRGKATFCEPSLDMLLGKMGFHMTPARWPFSGAVLFERLAPFIEYYYANDDLEINHWLRRRLHWLGATVHNA